MKHLRWLVITSFGLVAAGALGRTASLLKTKKTHEQKVYINMHIGHIYRQNSFSESSGLKYVRYSLCPL